VRSRRPGQVHPGTGSWFRGPAVVAAVAAAAAALSTAACAPSGLSSGEGGRSPPFAAAGLGPDGVLRILPTARGLDFRLGDPNFTRGFAIERGTRAQIRAHGALDYFNVEAHDLEYSSGGKGKTIRLHVQSGPEVQGFTWRTQRGHLATERDLRNQEVTVFVRVNGIIDPRRAAVAIKIRGGIHSAHDPDHASCVMMTFQARSTGNITRFGKELVHPQYDYVPLTPTMDVALEEGKWVGLKLLSYSLPGAQSRVMNRLYVDPAPFDRSGHPRNDWCLLGVHVDVDGQRTGRYSQAVDWGGWITTVRADGVHDADFALLSAREIQPPLGPPPF
jgi:hypothetical protein